MKTKDKLIEAMKNLADTIEAYNVAEIEYEEAKREIILNDATYGAAKNEHVRNAYLAEKLAKEEAKLNKVAFEKRRETLARDIAEVEWKSEKYDIMLSVGKIV